MDDNEIITSLTNGGPGYLAMDEAFCARMRAAIANFMFIGGPRQGSRRPITG